MKFIWKTLILLISLFTWMLLFPYPAGGSFDWGIIGIPEGPTNDDKASFFYLMKEKAILCLENSFTVNETGLAAAAGPWRILSSANEDGLWYLWNQMNYQGEYQGGGVPFLKKGRFFQLSSDNTILKEISLESGKVGALLWEKTLPSSLTSLASLKETLALGFSMGEVWIAGAQGKKEASFNFLKQNDTLIMGLALAEYGTKTYLAVVEGWDEACWHLYEKKGDSWLEIASGKAGKSLKREVRLIFDPKTPILYIEGDGIFLDYQIKRGKLEILPKEGILIDAFHGASGTNYWLSHLPTKREVLLIQTFGSEVLFSWRWGADQTIEWAFLSEETLWLNPKIWSYAWLLKRNLS